MTRKGGTSWLGAFLSFGLGMLSACSASKVPHIDGGAPDGGPTCTTRVDCPNGWICEAPDGGFDGGSIFCQHCATNGQCQPDEACDPISLLCQFLPGWGSQCKFNADCSLGQFCAQGLCTQQVTLCTAAKKCPAGMRCQTQNNVCQLDLGCFGDTDCTPDQVCNLASHACEVRCTPDTVGSVCPAHWKCVGSRCVDCQTDADCGLGLTCNVAAGRCTSPSLCYSTADCAAGQVCNPVTQSCGPTPPPCGSNNDCLPTQVCDITSGRCVPGSCLPDLFEPNGSMQMAQPVVANLQNPYKGLTLCNHSGQQEQDWFKIDLQSGDTLYVNISTDVTGSGYLFVVVLVASDGTILTPTTLGTLQVTATIANTGTYYLRMTDGDTQTNYGFSVQVSPGRPCQPDAFDPNGSPLEAKTFDGGTGPVTLCAGQEDWYLAETQPAQPFQATLTCDPTQGLLALTLYDSDTQTVLDQRDGGDASETVATTKADGGPVYLKVSGDRRITNSYQLSTP